MLPNVLKHKKAVKCLKQKMCVLEELCSGMSYCAVVHEFKLMNPQYSILNKGYLNRNTHKIRLSIGQVMKML